ncbi:MAG: tRNA (guanosine(37)-N1)-methyltransferase TrmD [Deltaproteobacteria bacterium RIFCSPLOWO2_12_FULL_40_28]|nr:MAG: tRNA (guanosine(37)-N1)-methyltransferase TrmD [Deltaproteobacteria bacterium RIFCSPHIGHO2_02_FULL_40_28]OGQ20245.1 MAG: tRNA (guanosine(37)-N1)-methyltransferase TrmD [Deltaproteobacteria bacterium RIFCSPHIGHO2_12_FULL_40_32]OGQ40364.1 MAG: tRNA (guanosine(37)-N1)-methyltransferase TrmD [Deltaproteobacteria bacterium RIFCSPLOWO2_02_FULL_40_36]OGQ54821.1 MAG: tRNA (guanosine(37)-N1)-methyltransferase TrmD [Deltaproteobacteria bacterium RIFCSPLOWO2_12_FULL_40_28]
MRQIHILTLFPHLFDYFNHSILGRAQKKGLVQFFIHDLRNYSTDKHKSVDDQPYGGGAGMVLKVDVLVSAVRDLKEKFKIEHVVLMSPRGKTFSHSIAQNLSNLNSWLIICGRYEGLDERAIQMVVDQEISLGDYVITGGELASQVVADAALRLIPGVVGNSESPQFDSFANGLLEYPHYTRPAEFEGKKVPEILLNGNHEEIKKWRDSESLKLTLKNRPDLVEKFLKKQK